MFSRMDTALVKTEIRVVCIGTHIYMRLYLRRDGGVGEEEMSGGAEVKESCDLESEGEK